ncbi:hypothetical protein HAHE_01580 [Haloferula helveola]|uniref:Polysaccharide lyase n=1 Tax=Haloferula helveola TaxID=490095 RepID=A0ABN6H3S3_9BACT|nr:hypothetical protein HAHE_01580 [Haloferula helveola]
MSRHYTFFFAVGLAVVGLIGSAEAVDVAALYSQRGTDPTFGEIMKRNGLPRGSNSSGGYKGSTIRVSGDLVTSGPNERRKIPSAIKLHTLANSAIRRSDFEKWTRWYQEDGNTQVFRLFEGEENVRNTRKLAARVESFSELSWKKGAWHEWVGTYTIIKPHGAAIFQAKNNENDWSVQINMGDNGDIRLNHRRGTDKVMARNMVGKPFHIRVRDNGHDYEVYLNGVKQGEGSYARPSGVTSFRWGMYVGGNEMRHDAMIFVTGAGIDPKDYKPELAVEKQAPSKPPEPADPDPSPDGLQIPERAWTNADGQKIRAAGVYQAGSKVIHLQVDGEWIDYPLDKLSEDDRQALMQALDFEG